MPSVKYYFRNVAAGNYSIENVFEALASVLKDTIQASFYYTKRPLDIMAIFSVRGFQDDIHHITGAVNYLSLGLPKRRTIITVHDIGHYTNTLKGIRRVIYKYVFWVLPLNRASLITTISRFTKDELIREFQIPAGKIVVIPNPVHPNFRFIRRRINSIPVILQIGSGRNKNVETLIEAVDGMNVSLLLVRKPDATLAETLRDKGIKYEFRSNLSQEELVNAYAESDIVYFASTYEGFGLPVIEAQTVGRPVIISNISSLVEVSNNTAFATELNNAGQVRHAVSCLLSDPVVYDRYVEAGRLNVQRYSAKAVAKQYLSVYDTVLKATK